MLQVRLELPHTNPTISKKPATRFHSAMKFSKWSDRIDNESGIINLMKDLGNAKQTPTQPLHMLGGGNPARIPAIEQYFRKEMENILQNGREFETLIGDYAGPQGSIRFAHAIANLFNSKFGWNISSENVAVTNGSQMAFTILFKLFSGQFSDGQFKRILLPLVPEYIGYSEADEDTARFTSQKPAILHTSDHAFKYKINFSNLEIDENISAICVSRPTNPTGNLIIDSEVSQLESLAVKHDIPLIIDGAYGLPFPAMVYADATVSWNENVILTLSLSKLGLPGTRTGIVIAAPEVIEYFVRANAITTLASGKFGSVLALNCVESEAILDLSENIIRPYYQRAGRHALDAIQTHFTSIPYKVHESEGAFFLWLWFQDMPISSEQLYENLKKRNVFIVPGNHFFPGLEQDWPHRFECIRISYTGREQTVEKGLQIVAQEVDRAYCSGSDQAS